MDWFTRNDFARNENRRGRHYSSRCGRSGEIPPCAIAGGNPVRVFKYRDTVHFENLKKQKKFY